MYHYYITKFIVAFCHLAQCTVLKKLPARDYFKGIVSIRENIWLSKMKDYNGAGEMNTHCPSLPYFHWCVSEKRQWDSSLDDWFIRWIFVQINEFSQLPHKTFSALMVCDGSCKFVLKWSGHLEVLAFQLSTTPCAVHSVILSTLMF